MAVLVKNLEYKDNCNDCRFSWPTFRACALTGSSIPYDLSGRLDDCPIREIKGECGMGISNPRRESRRYTIYEIWDD